MAADKAASTQDDFLDAQGDSSSETTSAYVGQSGPQRTDEGPLEVAGTVGIVCAHETTGTSGVAALYEGALEAVTMHEDAPAGNAAFASPHEEALEAITTHGVASPHKEALEAITVPDDTPARDVASPREEALEAIAVLEDAPARDVASAHEEALEAITVREAITMHEDAHARDTVREDAPAPPREEALEATTLREDAPARDVASPHEQAMEAITVREDAPARPHKEALVREGVPARNVTSPREEALEAITVCEDAPAHNVASPHEEALEAIAHTHEMVQMLRARGWRAPRRGLAGLQRAVRDDANARVAVGAIVPLLRHRRWRVRAAAGWALQRCAASSEGGHAAVEELAREDKAPAAFSALVSALPHAAQGLKQHLQAVHVARDLLKTEDPKAREAAVDGLGQAGGGAELKRLLEDRALSDDAWAVRMAAIGASVQLASRFVGQAVGEAALRLISGRIQDHEAAVRQEAAHGLVALSAVLPASVTRPPKPAAQAIPYGLVPRAPQQQDPSWMDRVCEWLTSRLADKSVHVRRTAAKLLRSLPGASVPRKALSLHLQSPDWWLWSAAVLTYLPGAPQEDKIWSILAEARQQAKGAALLRAIVRESEELRTVAALRLNVPSPLEKQSAQIKEALRHLEDLSWRERCFAVETLSAGVERGVGDAVTGAMERLSHGSSRVCIAAADVLAHMSCMVPSELSVKAVQLILELFNHPISDVRAKAGATLTAAATKGGISDSAVEAIVRVIANGSQHNMRRASHALTSMVEAPGYGSHLAEVTTRHLLNSLRKARGVGAVEVALSTLSQVAPRNHPEAQSLLRKMVAEPSPAVRLAALEALGAIATRAGPELRGAVWQCVEDPDEVVREVALEMQAHLREAAATRQREVCLDLLQELAVAFGSPQVQQRLCQLWRIHSGRDFQRQRQELLFEVQRKVLPKYHFESTHEGIRVMEQVCKHIARSGAAVEEKMDEVYQLMGLPPPEALQGRSAHRAARVTQKWSESLHQDVRGGPVPTLAAAPDTAATGLESPDFDGEEDDEEDVSSSLDSDSEGVPELEDREDAGGVLSGQE